ncbi:MAG: hypothetical protein RLY43_720 [Bacteroidota bacterium]
MRNFKLQKGFTLIELLVVVSIIALLSSIIVAGLTDARGGAKNNKRNELARQYVTGLSLFHGEHGYYPTRTSDNETFVCLGSGYPGGTCYVVGSHNENSSVNDQMSEFMPGTPASLETTVSGEYSFYGMAYRCTDENCIGYELSWIVEGSGSDAECFGGATKQQLNSKVGLCTYSTNS